jgi:hypothetical protein
VKLPVLSKPGADNSKPAPNKQNAPGGRTTGGPDSELLTQRDRLTERFALMQSELGGLFYEMAVRDHVQLDVLVQRAAELQKVDLELAQVEHLLAEKELTLGGNCPSCQTAYAKGAVFCSQCASPLPQS